jgi:hypothetical protein
MRNSTSIAMDDRETTGPVIVNVFSVIGFSCLKSLVGTIDNLSKFPWYALKIMKELAVCQRRLNAFGQTLKSERFIPVQIGDELCDVLDSLFSI